MLYYKTFSGKDVCYEWGLADLSRSSVLLQGKIFINNSCSDERNRRAAVVFSYFSGNMTFRNAILTVKYVVDSNSFCKCRPLSVSWGDDLRGKKSATATGHKQCREVLV